MNNNEAIEVLFTALTLAIVRLRAESEKALTTGDLDFYKQASMERDTLSWEREKLLWRLRG